MMMSYFSNSTKGTRSREAMSVTFAHAGGELKLCGSVYIHACGPVSPQASLLPVTPEPTSRVAP